MIPCKVGREIAVGRYLFKVVGCVTAITSGVGARLPLRTPHYECRYLGRAAGPVGCGSVGGGSVGGGRESFLDWMNSCVATGAVSVGSRVFILPDEINE